jgi:hypothetical protein
VGGKASDAPAGGDPPSNGAALADVIARMEAIGAELTPDDGVARFNYLYLAVTRTVAAEVEQGRYEELEFVVRLDVVFAGLYLAAVDAVAQAERPSRAWEPLFEARSRRGIAPIQFALAGMNAHINFDLCVALDTTCRLLDVPLAQGSGPHRDYLRLNETLERVQEQVKREYLSKLGQLGDEALGRVDDVVASWKVARARDAAWTHAEALGTLRASQRLAAHYLDVLGGMVGLAGRGLLVPTLWGPRSEAPRASTERRGGG